MFSNRHISTSIKLCWNSGSGCRFIRGHSGSGKTASFFSCLLIEVALFQKPRVIKYHREATAKQIYDERWRRFIHISFLDTSLLHRKKAGKPTSSLLSASPLWSKALSTWMNCCRQLCVWFLSQRLLSQREGGMRSCVTTPAFKNIHVYRGQTADVNEKPGRGTRLSWWCRLPGGGWVLGASTNPTEGTVRSLGCHPSTHPSVHPTRRWMHSGISRSSHTSRRQGACCTGSAHAWMD